MDERQTRRTLLGALLIAALVAIGVLIFILDDLITGLRSDYRIVAVVTAAPGINDGSPVWIGGKEVGVVSRVAFLPSGPDTTVSVALDLSLPRSLQSQVRTDSRVRQTSSSLVGVRAIDILPGSAEAAMLQPGDTLRERQLPTPAELTAHAGLVKNSLDSLMQEVQGLSPLATARLEETRRAFAAMDAAMQDARALSADLRASPGLRLMQDPEFRGALERARVHSAELPGVLQQLRDRLGAERGAGPALQRLQARADSLALQLERASALLRTPNGSLARFQQDTALARALTAARAELDSLMVEVRRNPLKFLF